jgi:hypothetical protein
VHVYCEATGCHHSAPLKLAGVVDRYGEAASSNVPSARQVHVLRRAPRQHPAPELGGLVDWHGAIPRRPSLLMRRSPPRLAGSSFGRL